MTRDTIPKGARRPVRTRNVQPKHHDPYTQKSKPAGTMVCTGCGVVWADGRWAWGVPPHGEVHDGVCPACLRVRDSYPAGTIRVPLRLVGTLDAVRSDARNVEEAERAEHPLERVMAVVLDGDDVVVTTTGLHIARWIASRIQRQVHKKPDVHYGDENLVTIEWCARTED